MQECNDIPVVALRQLLEMIFDLSFPFFNRYSV